MTWVIIFAKCEMFFFSLNSQVTMKLTAFQLKTTDLVLLLSHNCWAFPALTVM